MVTLYNKKQFFLKISWFSSLNSAVVNVMNWNKTSSCMAVQYSLTWGSSWPGWPSWCWPPCPSWPPCSATTVTGQPMCPVLGMKRWLNPGNAKCEELTKCRSPIDSVMTKGDLVGLYNQCVTVSLGDGRVVEQISIQGRLIASLYSFRLGEHCSVVSGIRYDDFSGTWLKTFSSFPSFCQ